MSFVYFIQAGESGNIKIGISRSVISRLRKMQTDMPEKLRLHLVIAGDLTTERNLHAELKDFRVHGEWFAPHPSVLKKIDDLKSLAVELPKTTGRIPKTQIEKSLRGFGFTSNSAAAALGIAQGHMSNVLTGKQHCGVKMGMKLQELTGRAWHLWVEDSYLPKLAEAA